VASGGGALGIFARRYDPAGVPLGELNEVESQPPDTFTAISGGSETLVAWGTSGGILARSFGAADSLGLTFSVANSGWEGNVRLAGAHRGSEYLLAWSTTQKGNYYTRVARITAAGVVSPMANVLATAKPHSVVNIVPTTSGYVLLLTSGAPSFNAYAIVFDEKGVPETTMRRLLGSIVGHDLASVGGELAIVAGRAAGVSALRPFDAKMAPLGSWVCLAAPPAPPPPDTGGIATVAGDGTGYAALAFTSAGATELYRTDRLGTGAP